MSRENIYEIRCGDFDVNSIGKVLKTSSYAKISECKKIISSTKNERDIILQKATQLADEIVASAKQKAKEIVGEAQKTKKEEEKRGYEDGLNTGKQEIADVMMDFVAKSAESFSKLEHDVTEVVKIALRKIIGKIDKTELIVNVVKTALQKIKMQKHATMKVYPSDVQILRDKVSELTHDTPVLEFLDITSDNRLQPGACILETELGVIDASLEVQLSAIEASLSKFKS